MSKELQAFRKICKNLNSYEFTDEYKNNKKLIETALKNYEELTSKPIILYGRTHGNTQALIDTVCKNYKEVKITNLEDEEKVKAFEIIKKKRVDLEFLFEEWEEENWEFAFENYNMNHEIELTQEEYDSLKKVMV